MSIMTDLEAIKRKSENMRQERDRAQGRLEEAQKRLKAEFAVDSIEEAQKLLKKLTKKEDAAREEFELALKEFNDKWGDELDE
ncbi:MAG TPA: hypothetical protein VMW50_09165 [Dehalococcoidia bacterium]|nr:hypothetical protein [Dehalococcoidia bacterium]